MNTGGNLGGMLAPFITPLIASRFGWAGGLYFGCLIVLLSAVTWFFLTPEHAADPLQSEGATRILTALDATPPIDTTAG